MERSSQIIFILIIFSLHLTFIIGSNNNNNNNNNNVEAIFIFGDSIFDAGNNHYKPNCTIQADFAPYGSKFFHHPTGRFTNGRTVADFISQFLEIPLQKPFMELELEIVKGAPKSYPTNGINFASSGSGVLRATSNGGSGATPIQDQLQQFQKLVDQNLIDKKLVKESLFFFESGTNDIFSYFNAPTITPEAYVQSMLIEVRHFMDTICKLGARRVVLFALGPGGCVPARTTFRGGPLTKCYGKMNKMVKAYNMALENIVLRDLGARYPGAVMVYGDVYKTFKIIRDDPKRYGFANVDSACCGYGKLGGELQCGKKNYILCKNPDDHIFWDLVHPSERANKLISKALWAGDHNHSRPFNLKRLSNMTLPDHI